MNLYFILQFPLPITWRRATQAKELNFIMNLHMNIEKYSCKQGLLCTTWCCSVNMAMIWFFYGSSYNYPCLYLYLLTNISLKMRWNPTKHTRPSGQEHKFMLSHEIEHNCILTTFWFFINNMKSCSYWIKEQF